MEELAKGLHQAVHETLQETGELKQVCKLQFKPLKIPKNTTP